MLKFLHWRKPVKSPESHLASTGVARNQSYFARNLSQKNPLSLAFIDYISLMGNDKIPDNITVNFRWHSRLWFQARYGFHRATWPKFFHDKLTSSNYKPPEKRQVHRSEMPLTIIGQLFVYTSPSSNFFSQQMLQFLLAYSQATSLDLSEANRSQRPV